MVIINVGGEVEMVEWDGGYGDLFWYEEFLVMVCWVFG